MTFNGLNFLGVLVAFIVSFASGGIWFGPKTFYPIWMKAKGIPTGQLDSNQNKPALLFGGTIIGVLVQTLTLGLIVTSLQHAGLHIGISEGAFIGFSLGVGIAMFASLSHRFLAVKTSKSGLLKHQMMRSI